MVGSARPQKVDVRLIAGTNNNLQALIAGGRFREDLFYRLNVINIELPPLRARAGDVLLLVRYFSAKYADEMGRPAPQFTDHALEHLGHYPWPGNVRELENLVQRLMAMADDDLIDAPDLPAGMLQKLNLDELHARRRDVVEPPDEGGNVGGAGFGGHQCLKRRKNKGHIGVDPFFSQRPDRLETIDGHGNFHHYVFMNLGQLIGFHNHISTGSAQHLGTYRSLNDFTDFPDLIVKGGNILNSGLSA